MHLVKILYGRYSALIRENKNLFQKFYYFVSAGSGSSIELTSPREEQPPGMILLRKKSDDDAIFGGIVRPKTSKRSKRDKRRSFVSCKFISL